MLEPFVSSSEHADFQGEVHFSIPTVYQQIAIERRKSELAAPYRWEELTLNGRGLIEIVATLEAVIHSTTIKALYDPSSKLPKLDPSRLSVLDEDLLIRMYEHYKTQLDFFRRQRESNARGAAQTPRGDSVVSSGATVEG